MQELISPFVNVLYFLLTALFLSLAFKRVMAHLDKKEDRKLSENNQKLIENFDHIHAILSFHMEGAYETVHKDNILTYSLDGTKPDEKEIDKISKEFIKLTMRLAGPNMLGVFVDLYGDEDALFFVMLDYFNRRFEDDEVRAQAMDDIQNQEDI